MKLNEQEKNLIARIFGNPSDRETFNGILKKKLTETLDISTFKQVDFEKELSIELIYAGRINLVKYLESFISELNFSEVPAQAVSKPRI